MQQILIIPNPAVGHAHAADLDTCLDFVNTLSYTDGFEVEGLPAVDDAIAFLERRDLAHDEDLRKQIARDGDAAWLARLHAVRGALRETWDAQVDGRVPDQAALDTVNAVLREAPRIELVAGDDCCGIGHRHSADDATGEALAHLVEPFVKAIAAGDTGRFRICANDGCRWVFEDTSRGGRRRWCDMSSCGNRDKVRRYRSRHRADEHETEHADQPAAESATAGSPADAAVGA
jgi:predicted RNA-binding Zn ribbon-like protein